MSLPGRNRGKSVQFRAKVYSKLTLKRPQQAIAWELTKRQMDLGVFVQQISEPWFEMQSGNQTESLKQNLLLKKEIIREVNQLNIDKVISKLEIMLAAITVKDFQTNKYKHISNALLFLKIWKITRQENPQYTSINTLGSSRVEELLLQKSDGLTVKILSVFCFSLIILKGVLLKQQQRKLVSKIIVQKRNYMSFLQGKQRFLQFQNILYLLKQFYRAIFLINPAHHLLSQYYRQLTAYIQIYSLQSKTFLVKQQLHRLLKDMQPERIGINVYQDSAALEMIGIQNWRRQVLGVDKQFQLQGLKNQTSKYKISQQLVSNVSECTASAFNIKIKNRSNEKIQQRKKSLKRLSSIEKVTRIQSVKKINLQNKMPLKLTISNQKPQFKRKQSLKLDQLKFGQSKKTSRIHTNPLTLVLDTSQRQSLAALCYRDFSFQFIRIQHQVPFIVQLQLRLHDPISITLKINKNQQIYRLKGILNPVPGQAFYHVSVFLQTVVSKIFQARNNFQALHRLTVDSRFVPANFQQDQIVPAIIRIKQFVISYLNEHSHQQTVTGCKHIYPKIDLKTLNYDITKHYEDFKKKQGSFNKRIGMLLLDSGQNNNLQRNQYITLMVKQLKPPYSFFILQLVFRECFKGIDIHCFGLKDQPPCLNVLINKCKLFQQKDSSGNQVYLQRKKLMNEWFLTQKIPEFFSPINDFFKVEEQVFLATRSTPMTTVPLKVYQKAPENTKNKRNFNKNISYQTLKWGDTYAVFQKAQKDVFFVYSGYRWKLFLPKTWRQQGFSLQNIRLRMYKCLKVTKDNKYFNFNAQKSPAYQSQKILLEFVRHYIISYQPGYAVVNQYLTPESTYFYQIFYQDLRYFGITTTRLTITRNSWRDGKLSGSNLIKYEQPKRRQGCLSQANRYYTKLRDQKLESQ